MKPKRWGKIARFGVVTATIAVLVPLAAGAVTTPPAPTLGYDPATDGGSLSFISTVVGAQSMWEQGYTGKGVDVAVIDTGVARVPGLNQVGKVIDGADLSFDSQNPKFSYTDGFGHGTMMASIIAGTDVTSPSKTKCSTCLVSSTYSDTTKFVGIAPGARIVNVKAGASDGSTDVSQVIAAIDWVVEHRTDNGMNIRVINLSYGVDSTQAADIDPLSYAAEVAWRKGIVVVASAGNDGMATPSLASPAYNPTIISVGAFDDKNTSGLADDAIPTFSQHGNGTRGVDVVAPGTHILGLRVPGSFVDANVTTGKVGTRFQRGSGTSESAAVVSGVAALLLQKFPTATPDQIKAIINITAQDIRNIDNLPQALKPLAEMILKWWAGNGTIDADAAGSLKALPAVASSPAYAKGTGLLEAARGTSHLVSNGVSLTGEKDIMSTPWDGVRWSGASWTGASWTGGLWNGVRWSGDTWASVRWSTSAWTGADWAGVRWSGVRWSSMAWDGVRWYGAGWDGVRWSGAEWDGVRWSNSSWD
jgi:serine protease AprX